MKQFFRLVLLCCALFHSTTALARDRAASERDSPVWRRVLMPLRVGMVASAKPRGEGTIGVEASLPMDVDGEKNELLPVRVFGPVLQWQRLHKHDRVMLGLEWAGPIPLGLEAGWAYWETKLGPMQGIHFTPFHWIGLISLGPRFFIPVTTSAAKGEVGLNVYLKCAPFRDGLGLLVP